MPYISLKEEKYLLHFSLVEQYLIKEQYDEALALGEEIGAILWSAMKTMQ